MKWLAVFLAGGNVGWSLQPIFKFDSYLERSRTTNFRNLGLSFRFFFYLHVSANSLKAPSERDAYLLKIFMVASKKAITRCWLRQNSPTLKLFINIINPVHNMEAWSFTLQKVKGEECWNCIRIYLLYSADCT